VCYWIKNLNLSKDYSDIFRKNNIDGDVLKYLIRDDLNGMQITAVGNLIKLEKNIREVNTRNSNENSNQISQEISKNIPHKLSIIPTEHKKKSKTVIEQNSPRISNNNNIIEITKLCFIYSEKGASTVLKFNEAKVNNLDIKYLCCPEKTQ